MTDLVIALFSSNHLNRNAITAFTYVHEGIFNSDDSGQAKLDVELELKHIDCLGQYGQSKSYVQFLRLKILLSCGSSAEQFCHMRRETFDDS